VLSLRVLLSWLYLHLPDVAHLADHVHLVNLVGGPAHHADPVLEVGLLHRFALGDQTSGAQVSVDFQDGGAPVGTPFFYGVQLVPKGFLGDSGHVMNGDVSGHWLLTS